MEEALTKPNSIYRFTRIALFSAAFCILAPLAIPIPISPVPISFTNMIIFLSVMILDWKASTCSYIVYLLLGAAGLPVFSGYQGGLAKLAGPTGGYLIGFILLAIIAGKIYREDSNISYFAGVIAGEFVMYIIGTAWLSYQLGVTFGQGLFVGVIPYLPGDAIKMVIAFILGRQIKARIKSV